MSSSDAAMFSSDSIKKAARASRTFPSLSQLYAKSSSPFHASILSSAPSEHPPSSAANDRVALLRADITSLEVDCIVNAANKALLGGGGVDGAIHRAAGRGLLAECRTLGGCKTGFSKITKGYNLPAKHVIHTVGPVYDDAHPESSEALLRSCYSETLKLAAENGIRTVAFSGISTGIYGYPSGEAAEVACDAVRRFLDGEEGGVVQKVIFVTFLDKDVDAYHAAIPKYFPPVDKADQQSGQASMLDV